MLLAKVPPRVLADLVPMADTVSLYPTIDLEDRARTRCLESGGALPCQYIAHGRQRKWNG